MKEKNLLFKFIPGGLYTTIKLFGSFYLLKLVLKSIYEYTLTFLYLLFTRGFRQAYSFFYTKMFVPTGEGAGAGIYFLFNSLIRKYPVLAPFPKYIEIEVTTICPRKCIMCEHTYWKDQEEKHLSFNEFKHIVDNFTPIHWLQLTGEGSAFTNPDYIKMLEYAKEKKASLYLVDSFDMINEDIMRKIIELKLEGIYISIDASTKEIYEKIRIGCSFDRVLRNVKRFLELKREYKSLLPEVSFRYTLLQPNINDVPGFVEIVGKLDKKAMGMGGRLDFVGNLEFNETKNLTVNKIPNEIINKTMASAKKYGVNVFFSHIETKKNPCINQCIAWLEPYVMMGGYVLPCCSILMSNKRETLRKHAFGNINEKSMKEIWKSERYKKFRRSVNDSKSKVPFLCSLCRSYDFNERRDKYGIDEEL